MIIRGKKVVGKGLDIDSQVVSKNYKKQETEFPVLRFIRHQNLMGSIHGIG